MFRPADEVLRQYFSSVFSVLSGLFSLCLAVTGGGFPFHIGEGVDVSAQITLLSGNERTIPQTVSSSRNRAHSRCLLARLSCGWLPTEFFINKRRCIAVASYTALKRSRVTQET